MHRLRIVLLPAFGLVCLSLVVRAAEPAGRVVGAAPTVDLGFRIEQMVLDPAGKTALVWGPKASEEYGSFDSRPMRLALVDLDRPRVLAGKDKAGEICAAGLDDKYIYLADGDALRRLDRSDPSKQTRFSLGGRPERIEPLPGGQLAVRLVNHPNAAVAVFDRETLKRIPGHFAETDPAPLDDHPPAIVERGRDGTLVFADKFVDAATGEVRCVLESNRLPALVDSAARKNSMPALRSEEKVLWGRTIANGALKTAQGAPIDVSVEWWNGVLSPFDPLAACVRYDKSAGHIPRRLLELREIKAGRVLCTVDLGDVVVSQEPNGYSGRNPTEPLQVTRDRVVRRDGKRLLAWHIPDDVKQKAVPLLALKIPKIPVVSVEKAVEVQFATLGGEGVPTFALTKGYDGLSIDAVHGKVTIDLPKIWKQYLAGGAEPATPFAFHVQPAVATPGVAAIYQRLTGAPLPAGKTALRLPLRVGVTNVAGESDELRLSVIVLGPQNDVDKLVARQQEACNSSRSTAIGT
jgi:hypothetical protein